jgi:hypothetical protein
MRTIDAGEAFSAGQQQDIGEKIVRIAPALRE